MNLTNETDINKLIIQNETEEHNVLNLLDNKIKIGFEFEFKIAVFDLDKTLWDEKILYKDTINILKTLYRYNIRIYLVSYNLDADKVCKLLNIEQYFDKIFFDRSKSKLQYIKEILELNENIKDSELIFFDDLIYNISEVKLGSNVQTVHINDGIDWTYIPIKYVYRFYHYLYE
jgi:predicted phosphatase